MNTEAGKIQGKLHTWGIKEVQNQKVPFGNYDIEDEDVLKIGLELIELCLSRLQKKFVMQLSEREYAWIATVRCQTIRYGVRFLKMEK